MFKDYSKISPSKSFIQSHPIKTALVETTKVSAIRQAWAIKGVNLQALPQAEIKEALTGEMTTEKLNKIIELSGMNLTDQEFNDFFGHWYEV